MEIGCLQWFKDTNLKANHNPATLLVTVVTVVSNGSKILIWKQITTICAAGVPAGSCLQWFKDTNLKANHNLFRGFIHKVAVVSNGSKILIWKQITTNWAFIRPCSSCLQWFKDTNLKANHNLFLLRFEKTWVVSNGSKILIWKQITTCRYRRDARWQLSLMAQRY